MTCEIRKRQYGSFRGVAFHVKSVEGSIGQRVVEHQFYGRQSFAESTGPELLRFNVAAELYHDDPEDHRIELLAALAKPGPGELVLPGHTRSYQALVDGEVSFSEARNTMRLTEFSLKFVEWVKNLWPSDNDATQAAAETANFNMTAYAIESLGTRYVNDGLSSLLSTETVAALRELSDAVALVRLAIPYATGEASIQDALIRSAWSAMAIASPSAFTLANNVRNLFSTVTRSAAPATARGGARLLRQNFQGYGQPGATAVLPGPAGYGPGAYSGLRKSVALSSDWRAVAEQRAAIASVARRQALADAGTLLASSPPKYRDEAERDAWDWREWADLERARASADRDDAGAEAVNALMSAVLPALLAQISAAAPPVRVTLTAPEPALVVLWRYLQRPDLLRQFVAVNGIINPLRCPTGTPLLLPVE